MACTPRREAQLKAQGWTRQFMTDEPRLGEALEEYRNLGFEVHTEEVDPGACGQGADCIACFQSPEAASRFKVIFTRKPPGKPGNNP